MARKRVYVKLPAMPGWNDTALDSLDAYLADVIVQCRAAYFSLADRSQRDDTGWTVKHRQYWKNAAGAIRWLRGNIQRQRTARRPM